MASNPRIDELKRRLEKEPSSRLFAQLAEELRKEGDLPEAVRLCREGLQKHPNYPSARITLGRALLDTGDAAGARGEFESALRGAPDNILASRYLAESLEALGDPGGAIARYKQTLLLSPGDKQVQARLSDLEARKSALAAAAAPASTERGASAAAAEAPIPLVAADEAFELERPYEAPLPGVAKAAEAGFAATLAGGPEEAEVATTLPAGHAPEFASDATMRALPASELAPKPESPEIASSTLAELYFNQGFTDKALEVYQELVRREPDNQKARARLAELAALDRHLRAEPAGSGGDVRTRRRQALERSIARLEALLLGVRAARKG